nr:hypothetical protein [Mobilicoccus caccae]
MSPALRRVSVRRRLPGGEVGDVVGHLLEETKDSWSILPEDRPAIVVPRADVVAWREVPPRAVRPSSSAGDVSRLLATHWPGTETARLGGWLLRAGGGFTKRANSALTDGDPGCARGEALELVRAWYAERGMLPHLSVLGGPTERAEDPGWVAFDETLVLACDLRRLSSGPGLPEHVRLEVDAAPQEDWLDVWRSGIGRGRSSTPSSPPRPPATSCSVRAHRVSRARGSGPVGDGPTSPASRSGRRRGAPDSPAG